MIFYLGAPYWSWIGRLEVPLCVSIGSAPAYVKDKRGKRGAEPKALPLAPCAPVVVDGRGYVQMTREGAWTTTPREHAAIMRRAIEVIGASWVPWVAIQDWMCEPDARKKTGLSVEEHIDRTITSYIELMGIAPELPWLPVIQGWRWPDYRACVELYLKRGVDLRRRRAGIGTVCSRSDTFEGASIVSGILDMGILGHAFGAKRTILRTLAGWLSADQWDDLGADSMAWSEMVVRQNIRLPGHDRPGPGRPEGHATCATCPDFALLDRSRLLAAVGRAVTNARAQQSLF